MNKYIVTFGSSQLKEWASKINPMKVILVLEDKDEWAAREQLMDTPIKRNFSFSYTYDKSQKFQDKYGMKEYTLKELMDILD